MTDPAFNMCAEEPPHGAGAGPDSNPLMTGRLPRITVEAFCHTPAVRGSLDAAFADRRMSRVRATVRTGGVRAARAHYAQAPTPNLLVVEAPADRAALLVELAELSEVCDIATKVVVIGETNDVGLYRDLLDRGIADYLVAPLDAMRLLGCVFRLYGGDEAHKLGRSCAFIGAKGGVGSSTLAHNVAWTIAHRLELDTILADLDLPFGSAGLNFNVDGTQGVAEAIAADGLDDLLLERLLVKRSERLGLLAAPGLLPGVHDPNPETFERLLEVVQSMVPFVVLDVPHHWAPWVETVLRGADEIVVTTTADLAGLRNAKALVEILTAARPNDQRPRLVLNQIGIAKREEIAPAEFASALEMEPAAVIAFEPKPFSHAANKGQMITEAAAGARACKAFDSLAELVTGRIAVGRKRRAGLFGRWWRAH